jgi:hypothetical protein
MTQQEATAAINAAIETLATQLDAGRSDAMTKYLTTMARFHKYRWGNQLLIHVQRPDASHVAGFNNWLKFGRHVKKGEKGIAILAPCTSKMQRVETENGEETTVRLPVRNYRTVYVFDVTQTDGEALAALNHVSGDPGAATALLEAYASDTLGITLEYVPTLGKALGQASNGRIEIVAGLDPAHRFSVLVHEVAHEMLHWSLPPESRQDKTLVETEAEAVAMVVCNSIGLDNATTAAADYIGLYRGNRDTLRSSLMSIHKAAGSILTAITATTQPTRAVPPPIITPHIAINHRGSQPASPSAFLRADVVPDTKRDTRPRIGDYVQVRDIPDDAIFVTDSIEVRELNVLYARKERAFDSFFVLASDGEITGVYGMRGIVPWIDRDTVLLYRR